MVSQASQDVSFQPCSQGFHAHGFNCAMLAKNKSYALVQQTKTYYHHPRMESNSTRRQMIVSFE